MNLLALPLLLTLAASIPGGPAVVAPAPIDSLDALAGPPSSRFT